MDIFLRATAGILVAVLLCLVLSKQGKDYSVLLSLTTCVTTLIFAISYLQPIFSFFYRLMQLGGLSTELFNTLLKITGIGFIAQIACLVCSDAGNKVLEKTLQIFSVITILWIAVPILEEVLHMMEKLLETV